MLPDSLPDCSFSSSPRGSWEERFPGWRESSAPIIREIGKAVASSDRLEKFPSPPTCHSCIPAHVKDAGFGGAGVPGAHGSVEAVSPLNLRKQVVWVGSSSEEALLEQRLDGKQSTAGLQTVLDWGAAGLISHGILALHLRLFVSSGFPFKSRNCGFSQGLAGSRWGFLNRLKILRDCLEETDLSLT
ncbi:hypothetical protein Chor_008271 [Crotalus horridus]